jgi:hypothetical protein
LLLGSPQKGQTALSTFKNIYTIGSTFIASSVVGVFTIDRQTKLGDSYTLLPLSSVDLLTPHQPTASKPFPALAEWHELEP